MRDAEDVGAGEHVERRPVRDDAPASERDRSVRQSNRLRRAVRHEEHRNAGPRARLEERAERLVPERLVEPGERLVEEQEARAVQDGARQRDAARLAARERGGREREERREPERLDELGPRDTGAAAPHEPLRDVEVRADGQVREEVALLRGGRRSPARRLTRVDFPAPEGPTTASVAASAAKETSSASVPRSRRRATSSLTPEGAPAARVRVARPRAPRARRPRWRWRGRARAVPPPPARPRRSRGRRCASAPGWSPRP